MILKEKVHFSEVADVHRIHDTSSSRVWRLCLEILVWRDKQLLF